MSAVTITPTTRTEAYADDVADTLEYTAGGATVAYLDGYTDGTATALLVRADGTTRRTPRTTRALTTRTITRHTKSLGH